MARTYSIDTTIAALSTAKDILRVSAPATAVLELIRVEVTQDTSETSEQLPLSIYRASTAGTGTARTPRPYEVGDPAAAATAVSDLSADTTKSPAEPLWTSAQNVLAGWLYHPVPDERIVVPPSGSIAVRLETAPGAALATRIVCTFKEVG
jgi:hypothetical protein